MLSETGPPSKVVPIHPVEEVSLYEIRRKIYPRAVHGWFARWRVILVLLTQLVFYGVPWLSWNGRQAVLFDLEARRFYIFGGVFWPQDVIYLTALLIIAAMALFLFTSVAGRLWCGYACPQTVYTEIFMWIERRLEGDRLARIRLDAAPLSAEKLARKSGKHAAWIAVSVWTGFTFVGYFTPIRTLLGEVQSLALGPWETFWILFYGLATYGNAGWMREQVCKYMCPYARFQGVMFDRDTLIITYDSARGEPRGPRSKKADPEVAGLGHCVDCGVCVQVCPTGIDIRKGLQYECIGCAACIDGCNQVMERWGYPRGLIRYATENALLKGFDSAAMWRRVFRPRTWLYTGVLATVVVAVGVTLSLRNPLKVDVIRDRGVLAREAEPGVIENVYRLQIMNTDENSRRFVITATGLDGLRVTGVEQPLTMAPASSRMVPVQLRVAADAARPGTHPIEFTIQAVDEAAIVRHEKSSYHVPR